MGPSKIVPGRPHGDVAEWQTRTVQVRVSERTWGFNSPHPHECEWAAHARGERGPGSPSSFLLRGPSPRKPRVALVTPGVFGPLRFARWLLTSPCFALALPLVLLGSSSGCLGSSSGCLCSALPVVGFGWLVGTVTFCR